MIRIIERGTIKINNVRIVGAYFLMKRKILSIIRILILENTIITI